MILLSKPIQLFIVAAVASLATLASIILPFALTQWNLMWLVGIPTVVGLTSGSHTKSDAHLLVQLATRMIWVFMLVGWSFAIVFVTLVIHGT